MTVEEAIDLIFTRLCDVYTRNPDATLTAEDLGACGSYPKRQFWHAACSVAEWFCSRPVESRCRAVRRAAFATGAHILQFVESAPAA